MTAASRGEIIRAWRRSPPEPGKEGVMATFVMEWSAFKEMIHGMPQAA